MFAFLLNIVASLSPFVDIPKKKQFLWDFAVSAEKKHL